MKTKHALVTTLVLVPVCTLLRILQYIFVVDADGYYKPDGAAGYALTYAFYGAIALCALASLAFLLWGSREKIDSKPMLGNRICGMLFVGAAALMTLDFGISAGNMMRSGSVYIPSLLELVAALFFAFVGYNALSGRQNGTAVRILGLSAPAFAIAVAISEFFGSFEKAHVSRTRLEMLSLCALALFFMTLVSCLADLEITEKRLAAVSLLYAVIAGSCAVADAFALACGEITVENPPHYIVMILLQTVFAALAIAMLVFMSHKSCDDNLQ